MNRIAIALVSACFAGCATFPPKPAVTARGYEGARRAESEVATVYISDGRPHYEAGFICKVNGRPATADGGCASIVYLLPGNYRLGIRYQSRIETGEGEIGFRVEAGTVYQLNATSFRTRNAGMIQVLPAPANAKLVYRNVAPNLFPEKLDSVIPYDSEK
jgi:hypothetical protein